LESVKFETQPGLGYRRSFFISTSGTIVDRPYTLLNFVNDIWFQWALRTKWTNDVAKEGSQDQQAGFAILVEREDIVIVQDYHVSALKTNMRLCKRLPL